MKTITDRLTSLWQNAKLLPKWAAAHQVATFLIVVAVAGGAYWYHKSSSGAATVTYAYAQVELGSLSSSVSGSGQVSSLNQIEVKPKVSGNVTYVAFKPGQYVHKGQTLFVIDAREAQKAVRDAELGVQMAQFDLDNAKSDLTNTKASNDLTLGNQLATLNSTVTAVPSKDNYQTDIVSISGSYNSTAQGRYTLDVYDCLIETCLRYSGIESGSGQIKPNVPIALGTRGLYVTFTKQPVAMDEWYIDVPSPLASSYASNSKSYTEKVQSAKESLEAAEKAVTSKGLALQQRQNALLDARQNLSDYYVSALFDGTISSMPVEAGELVSPSTVLTTLISDQKLAQISLNEVDAAKVSLGQKVSLAFDALPDVRMEGTVSELDVLGTENQGVVTYDAKVDLDQNDPRIKSGMSVSADIITASKENILTVPNSAIKSARGKSYVEMRSATSSALVRVPVEVGISNDTRAEIVSGLTQGDEIVGRTINSANAAAAASAPSLFGGGSATRRVAPAGR